jgi:hypothetical protein
MGDLLKGPIAGVLDAVGGIIGKFVASPEDKLKATEELLKVHLDFQTKVMEAETAYVKTQADVIMSEAKSESWLAANWRPMLMLVFTYIIAHNYVIAPMFSVKSVPIPPDMWELLRLGIGGYVAGRSLEKMTPIVADAFVRAKADK